MTSKILQFPESRIVRDYPNTEFLKEAEEKAADGFTINVTNICIDEIMDIFEAHGLVSVKESALDMAFIMDAIESAICRILEKPHYLHERLRVAEDEESEIEDG